MASVVCIESAKTNVASGFYVCLMCELLFCAAMLAECGVFGDFLSAVVAEHCFAVLLGHGDSCVFDGAENVLDVFFVGIDHISVHFGRDL